MEARPHEPRIGDCVDVAECGPDLWHRHAGTLGEEMEPHLIPAAFRRQLQCNIYHSAVAIRPNVFLLGRHCNVPILRGQESSTCWLSRRAAEITPHATGPSAKSCNQAILPRTTVPTSG